MSYNIKKLRIIVLCGGISTEKDISIKSGKSVLYALTNYGFEDVSIFYFNGNNLHKLLQEKPDLVYMALHGKCGEDGCIQGALEAAGIKYTGPGVAASAVCMNKILTKKVLKASSIPTPNFIVIQKNDHNSMQEIKNLILKEFSLPFVIKVPDQGSSIGVYIIKNEKEVYSALDEAFSYNEELLIEEYIEGKEITLPIIGNRKLSVFPDIEIISKTDFYDFNSKYTQGLSSHIIPSRIDKVTREKIILFGKKAYKVLGCKGISRIDFIVNNEGEPFILEVNTSPGMTSTSLFPDSAASKGMTLGELVYKVIELALEDII